MASCSRPTNSTEHQSRIKSHSPRYTVFSAGGGHRRRQTAVSYRDKDTRICVTRRGLFCPCCAGFSVGCFFVLVVLVPVHDGLLSLLYGFQCRRAVNRGVKPRSPPTAVGPLDFLCTVNTVKSVD